MISVGSVVQIYSGPPFPRTALFRGISSAGRAPGLQPGGHRFEPGILHFALVSGSAPGIALERTVATRSREAPPIAVVSLTIEYPANGSFSDHKVGQCPQGRRLTNTHAVCKELSRVASGFRLPASSKSTNVLLGAGRGSWRLSALVSSFYGQATKGVR